MQGCRLARLPVEHIAPSPHQARRVFDDAALDTLAASIDAHGLISPIVVRPKGDGYELIAGERRLRAVSRLGHTEIDALVADASGCEAALMTLVENVQRENLHYLEQAEAFARLQNAFGFSQQTLAGLIGLSQPAVANKLRLLALPAPTRSALIASGLGERQARTLLTLPDVARQLEAIALCRQNKLNATQFDTLVRRMRTDKPAPKPIRLMLRDRRLVLNAVLGAVKSLRQAGIDATSRIQEGDETLDIIVSFPLAKLPKL